MKRTKPHARRRSFCTWTPAEDAALREMWGDYCERELRDALGRTTHAIYQRASLLGLGPQSEVRRAVSLSVMSDRLGIHMTALRRMLASCGIAPWRRAPVSKHGGPSGPKTIHTVVDPDQVEALFVQRNSRTATRSAYSRAHDVDAWTMTAACAAAGFPAPRRGGVLEFTPVGALEEALRGERGPWSRAWLATSAVDREAVPHARWVLALAAHDIAHGDADARDWTEWLPQQVLNAAREIAATLRDDRPGVATAKPQRARRAA